MTLPNGETDCVILVRDVSVAFARHGAEGYTVRDLLRALRGRNDAGRRFWAIRGVSFDLRRGECLGLIGRNGSGKTTLLKTISGVIQPDGGHVWVDGRVTALHPGAGFRQDLSGLDNVFLNGSVLGLTRSEIRARLATILEFSELGDFIHMPIRCYSTGMRARLAFAIATTLKPEILLIDESLSSGDESFRTKAEARLRALLREARGIIIVSHAMSFVLRHCTRVIWLRNGRCEAEGDAQTVVRSYLDYCKQAAPLNVETGARRSGIADAPPGAATTPQGTDGAGEEW